jgi:RNase P protein component
MRPANVRLEEAFSRVNAAAREAIRKAEFERVLRKAEVERKAKIAWLKSQPEALHHPHIGMKITKQAQVFTQTKRGSAVIWRNF